MTNPSEIERLRRQQGALADFGIFAFREDDLAVILTEAACICAKSLDVPFAQICRYRPQESDLQVVANCGWHPSVVGLIVSKADQTTTQGRAFITGEPVVLDNVGRDHSYTLPPFYAEHHIVSTADVPIQSKKGSWGTLQVESAIERHFDHHDIVFLTGFANVLAEAVVRSERTFALTYSIGRMEQLIAEKDQFLVEREKNAAHLRELQAELLHISRLNALGQMTAAITHEINQPLAAIANYLGAAKLTLAGSDSEVMSHAHEMIDKAQEQTLRAAKVISKLRDMVEKRESVRSAENLEHVVRGAMAIALFGSAESEMQVNITVADAIPAVLIDKVQIQQILFNLIRNSIEAMREVATRKLEIAISLGEPGFVEVTVQDTGTGMPPEVKSRLFLPFVTTKSDGMGLGLTICQTLVEANGGRIWRLDDVTTGTAFRFCLPYANAPGALRLVA